MSGGGHGGAGLGSLAKTGANYALGGVAATDAITSANIPGGVDGFGHGTPHFTAAIAQTVDALITNPNIQDPAGTATIVGVGAAAVGISGVRDVKEGKKKKGFAKLGGAAYLGAEAMNIFAGKGMALSQGVKAFAGRTVDIFTGLFATSPKAAQIWLEHGPWIMETFHKATPAVYFAVCYYFLNKAGLFTRSSGGGGHH